MAAKPLSLSYRLTWLYPRQCPKIGHSLSRPNPEQSISFSWLLVSFGLKFFVHFFMRMVQILVTISKQDGPYGDLSLAFLKQNFQMIRRYLTPVFKPYVCVSCCMSTAFWSNRIPRFFVFPHLSFEYCFLHICQGFHLNLRIVRPNILTHFQYFIRKVLWCHHVHMFVHVCLP
jgi:hypothetical protein